MPCWSGGYQRERALRCIRRAIRGCGVKTVMNVPDIAVSRSRNRPDRLLTVADALAFALDAGRSCLFLTQFSGCVLMLMVSPCGRFFLEPAWGVRHDLGIFAVI